MALNNYQITEHGGKRPWFKSKRDSNKLYKKMAHRKQRRISVYKDICRKELMRGWVN